MDCGITKKKSYLGKNFGFTTPFVLDLGILVLTFGLKIKITIGSILGILIATIIYHFI